MNTNRTLNTIVNPFKGKNPSYSKQKEYNGVQDYNSKLGAKPYSFLKGVHKLLVENEANVEFS